MNLRLLYYQFDILFKIFAIELKMKPQIPRKKSIKLNWKKTCIWHYIIYSFHILFCNRINIKPKFSAKLFKWKVKLTWI